MVLLDNPLGEGSPFPLDAGITDSLGASTFGRICGIAFGLGVKAQTI